MDLQIALNTFFLPLMVVGTDSGKSIQHGPLCMYSQYLRLLGLFDRWVDVFCVCVAASIVTEVVLLSSSLA